MNEAEVRRAVSEALDRAGALISRHIEEVEKSGRTTGIEDKFEAAFIAASGQPANRPRLPVTAIGSRTYYGGRQTGLIDFVVRNADGNPVAAFEFKAVRMPRRKSWGRGARFDQGQIVADYLRMANAKACGTTWVIVFVYGPLVSDACSAGTLFRNFHNQLTLDRKLGDKVDPMEAKPGIRDKSPAERRAAMRSYKMAVRALGWDNFEAYVPRIEGAFAVRAKRWDIGAICYRAR